MWTYKKYSLKKEDTLYSVASHKKKRKKIRTYRRRERAVQPSSSCKISATKRTEQATDTTATATRRGCERARYSHALIAGFIWRSQFERLAAAAAVRKESAKIKTEMTKKREPIFSPTIIHTNRYSRIDRYCCCMYLRMGEDIPRCLEM